MSWRPFEQHPDFTLKEVKVVRLVMQLSVTSIFCALDSRLITMKNLQECPAQWKSPRIKANYSLYIDWYLNETLNYHLCG